MIFQSILNVVMLLYLLISEWKYLQYACFYGVTSALAFIIYYNKSTIILSDYLRTNYPVIYRKHIGFRFYFFRSNLAGISASKIQKEEINEIEDKGIVMLIYNIRAAKKMFFLSFAGGFCLLVLFSVFHK